MSDGAEMSDGGLSKRKRPVEISLSHVLYRRSAVNADASDDVARFRLGACNRQWNCRLVTVQDAPI